MQRPHNDKDLLEPFCRLSFTIPHSFFRGNGYSIWRPFQQHFSYLVVVCYIGEGNRRTRRKPPTCRKPLTTFITKCCIKYTSPWAGFVLTTLVVIGNDRIGSHISNYHTITTTTAPHSFHHLLKNGTELIIVVKQMSFMVHVS